MANKTDVYKLRLFGLEDVMQKLGLSHSAAVASLARWSSHGLIKMVRRNMYVAIDPVTDTPVADKYELATKTAPLSYVGWHTALEFYGVAHQLFYKTYVGSPNRFNGYSFEGIMYEYCASPMEVSEDDGIVSPMGNPYVRVTDLERTIVDCCDRIDRAGGAEELLHCMEAVSILNETKLAKYLDKYNKTILYQKIGFVLEKSQRYCNISNKFIEMCRFKGAVHPQHLTNMGDSDTFVNSWKLYVPKICIATNNSEYELV